MAMTRTEVLSLPDGLRAEVEKVARAQERTINEVLADAVERYVKDEQWQSLKRYGRKKARELGIQERDVLRLITESRREHEQGR
jgi:predicted transcriptional regulator